MCQMALEPTINDAGFVLNVGKAFLKTIVLNCTATSAIHAYSRHVEHARPRSLMVLRKHRKEGDVDCIVCLGLSSPFVEFCCNDLWIHSYPY